ncbi:Hypothetical predicted protein [Marmota monax]|uniref:Uncharacterized protein n=1 Tax=Marmota monax TaxID=9995 RepID=A0A5E4BVQ7_MARMO|nr:hypothetical protein GHT09_010526 [Marmota monax]VTJ73100.1 Hypothetical predicted protein [Marmota monax]
MALPFLLSPGAQRPASLPSSATCTAWLESPPHPISCMAAPPCITPLFLSCWDVSSLGTSFAPMLAPPCHPPLECHRRDRLVSHSSLAMRFLALLHVEAKCSSPCLPTGAALYPPTWLPTCPGLGLAWLLFELLW